MTAYHGDAVPLFGLVPNQIGYPLSCLGRLPIFGRKDSLWPVCLSLASLPRCVAVGLSLAGCLSVAGVPLCGRRALLWPRWCLSLASVLLFGRCAYLLPVCLLSLAGVSIFGRGAYLLPVCLSLARVPIFGQCAYL